MMDGMNWMMGGVGFLSLLGLVVALVVVAAAIKYLFFDKRDK